MASRRSVLFLFLATFNLAAKKSSNTYYVSPKGRDRKNQDGLTWKTAWKTLAYACDRVPAGSHIIQLGSGRFLETRTAYPKAGITIQGMGSDLQSGSHITASPSWELSENPSQQIPNEYLIALSKVRHIKIHRLVLSSDSTDRSITGAIFCKDSKNIELSELSIHDFRWNGLYLGFSENIKLHDCEIKNANLERFGRWNGLVRTRWIKKTEIYNNKILSTIGGGYGYKGGGHEGVRIHHNIINVMGGFGIESPHESEYGVEIYNNSINRCISIPKPGPGEDPNNRGYSYSFWIHDNYLTDSYTVEGPRNHLRLSHNFIQIKKNNGRVYTHHGGINHGPIWIHHNVVENLDRAFVWMNEGLAENIFVYNNTVFCANASNRAGDIFGAYSGDRLNNWVIKNNIFVAHPEQARLLISNQNHVLDKIEATDNFCINILKVPQYNVSNIDPGLHQSGNKPWPFYAPKSVYSGVIDKGVFVGFNHVGIRPDIGAYEFGKRQIFPAIYFQID